MLLDKYDIFQMAYYVQDLEEGMERWAKLIGAAPFFVAPHHKCDQFVYRDGGGEADVSYAFAYAGDVQIQLIQQHDDTPSIYTDMFGPGEEGFHHIGVLVSDWDAERQRLLDMGFEIATELYADNVNAAYFDTRAVNSCFTEIHADPLHILGIFAHWKRAHQAWSPGDPIVAELPPSAL